MGNIEIDILKSGTDPERRKNNARFRRNRMRAILFAGICLIAFILIVVVSVALYHWVNADETVETAKIEEKWFYTHDEVEEITARLTAEKEQEILDRLAESLNSGSTVVESLRSLYKGDIVVASSGKYHFIPISDTLKKHAYTTENLQIAESGELSYVENGQVMTYKGIDVSKFNGTIDWSKVAADGVEFAFIRAGIRGYGTGKLVEDEGFEENVESALANGIKVGVYFFSQAITPEEAVEEAQFVKQLIAPYKIECPVVFDVEKVSDPDARMNKISAEERTRAVIAFCEEIEKGGYKPMVYYNMEMAALLLDLEQLEEYDKWFAYYNKDIYFPYDFKIWQYTDEGRVDGVEGDVDLNIAFEKIWE